MKLTVAGVYNYVVSQNPRTGMKLSGTIHRVRPTHINRGGVPRAQKIKDPLPLVGAHGYQNFLLSMPVAG